MRWIFSSSCGYRAWDGFLEVRVWNDENSNRVMDVGESPLEGIQVMLIDPDDKSYVQILSTDEGGLIGFFQPGGCVAKDVVVVPPEGMDGTTPVLVLGAKCTTVVFGFRIVNP